MTEATLTSHLLSLSGTKSSLGRATTHPFLTHAGAGTLPASVLTTWLVQDIHYTRGYVRFIGGVMSQLRLSTSINDSHGPGKTLHVRIFDLLLSALNNIQREMQFFEDTAKEYKLDLDLEAEMDDVTRMYVQCFDAVKSGSGAGGLIEGLTVLWATEHCYLTAWTHAKSHMKDSAAVDELSSATRALHTAFIPNWTCPEFLDFVNQCADVLNVVAAAEGLGKVSEPGTSAKKDVLTRCEHVWKQVLYLEERFWPQV